MVVRGKEGHHVTPPLSLRLGSHQPLARDGYELVLFESHVRDLARKPNLHLRTSGRNHLQLGIRSAVSVLSNVFTLMLFALERLNVVRPAKGFD